MEPLRLRALLRLTLPCLPAAMAAAILFLMLVATPLATLTPLAAISLAYLGFRMGLGALIWGSVLALGLVALLGGPGLMLVFCGLAGFPSLLLTQRCLQTYPPTSEAATEPEFSTVGDIIASAVLLAAITLAILHLVFLDSADGGLPAQLEQLARQGLAMPELRQLLEQFLPAEQIAAPDFAQYMVRNLLLGWPALTFWLWLMTLALAHGLAKATGPVLREDFDYQQWHLPRWMDGLLACATIVFLLAAEPLHSYGGAIAILCLAAYVLLGLSCVHIITSRLAWRRPILWAVYIGALLLAWPLVILGCIGLLTRPLHLQRQCDTWAKGKNGK